MTSQWAAVGAGTDLLRRARQLQMSWERLGLLRQSGARLLTEGDCSLLEGTERMHMRPVDVPEDGGQVVPDGGSVAKASALGRSGAPPLRDDTSGRSSPMSPATRDTSTEQRARELATEQAALRRGGTPGAAGREPGERVC